MRCFESPAFLFRVPLKTNICTLYQKLSMHHMLVPSSEYTQYLLLNNVAIHSVSSLKSKLLTFRSENLGLKLIA